MGSTPKGIQNQRALLAIVMLTAPGPEDAVLAVAGTVKVAQLTAKVAGPAIRKGKEAIEAVVDVAAKKSGEISDAATKLKYQAMEKISDLFGKSKKMDPPSDSASVKETLYNGGNLRGGQLDNASSLDTTPDLSHAEEYAKKSGGEVTTFEVPKLEIRKGELDGTVNRGTDQLIDESGSVVSEAPQVRFDFPKDQLEDYIKKTD